ALTNAGGVKCWGDNQGGDLGDGTTVERLRPVDVSGLTSGVVAIAAGEFHTCALSTAGGVKWWGVHQGGDLGGGPPVDRQRAVDVSGLPRGVVAIAARGSPTRALTTAGGVKCWGANDGGEVGDGTTVDRYRPVDVSGLTSGVVAIAAGGFHTCAPTS